MIGKELAKAVKAAKGNVYAWANNQNDGVYLAVVKSDLIAWALGVDDLETGFKLIEADGGWLLITDY